jgi:hypothetical protein
MPPILGGSDHTTFPEYPVALSVAQDLWILSDGAGRLFAIRVTADEGNLLHGTLVAYYKITDPASRPSTSNSSGTLIPTRIYDAFLVPTQDGKQVVQIVVATKNSSMTQEGSLLSEKTKHTANTRLRFQLSALHLDLSAPLPEDPMLSTVPLVFCWSVFGDDLPLTLPRFEGEYVAFASSQYGRDLVPKPKSTPRDPLPEEIAPIPRAGENLDASPMRAPLYSWTQVGDSLTVAFFLPAFTPKSHISITLSAKSLSLHIIDSPRPAESNSLTTGLQIPFFEKREWWDGIDSSASFWTWEKDGETREPHGNQPHTVGVLTLYLEKQHEDTRWPHLFSTTQAKANSSSANPAQPSQEQDDDVAETLDPTQLLAAREAFEKYTTTLATGEDASGLGLGTGIPSLAREELDEELDEDVGRTVVCTWLEVSHGLGSADDGNNDFEIERLQESPWPLDVLALPIAVSSPEVPGLHVASEAWSVVTRHDIDGLLYSRALSDEGSGHKSCWKHTATFPALSFVLASKRDTRFAVHLNSSVALAFESGLAGAGSGNVYIYRGVSGKSKWGKQAVLKVSGGSAGALLGVVALVDENKKIIFAALCENALVILKDVL